MGAAQMFLALTRLVRQDGGGLFDSWFSKLVHDLALLVS